MKTEEFDDAIRDKFNAPVPPVSEAEVDAVFRNINNRRLVKSNTRWRGYALFTIAALLFGGLLFWNIRLSTNQRNLVTEVKKLNERIEHSNAPETEKKGGIAQQEAEPTLTPIHSNSETRINKTYTNTQSSQETVSKQTNKSSTNLTEKELNKSGNNIASKNNEETTKQQEYIDSKITSDSMSNPPSENTKNITKTEASEQEIDVKKTVAKSKINFLTGIGADLSIPFTGLNLLEEIQIGKHWSITSGLRYLTFGDEQFGDEDEYNEKAHEEFKERFNAHVADSMEIGEIEIHDQFLQIPLLLNYRFPLKNGFEILLSTGSDINLYFRKNVQFVSKTPSNSETPVALTEKPDFKTVHDIRLGVGIQKNWNRYMIQLVPEAVYLFNTPNVFVKPFNHGIRIGAFYRI